MTQGRDGWRWVVLGPGLASALVVLLVGPAAIVTPGIPTGVQSDVVVGEHARLAFERPADVAGVGRRGPSLQADPQIIADGLAVGAAVSAVIQTQPGSLLIDLGISESNRKLRAYTHGNGVYEQDLIGGLLQTAEPAQ